MTNKRSRIIAWGLCGLAILGAGAQTLLWANHLAETPAAAAIVDTIGLRVILPITFSTLAALIIAHAPKNRIGWLMMISALGSVIPAEAILRSLPAPPAEVTPGIWLLLWIDNLSWMPIFFPIFLIPLHFPSGRPPTQRWMWVNWLALILVIVLVVLSIFVDVMAPMNLDFPALPNPIGFLPLAFLEGTLFLGVWGVGLLTVVTASTVSLFVRYRKTETRERQQIKWLLAAGGFFFLVYAAMLLMPSAVSDSAPIGLIFMAAILGIPVAIAIAIFRYRLWDLDVVINRALIYGPLTTFMAGTFAMVIAFTTELTKQALGDQSRALGAALSAVIVAVIFQPLRSRIETFVDKRFYPQKLDLATGLVEVQPEYWGFLDQDTLIRLAMEHVQDVLGTDHTAFYLAVGPDRFQMAQQLDDSAQGHTTIRIAAKQLEEVQKKRVISSEGTGLLTGHIPLFIDRGKKNELLGLLSIGFRTNGKGYSGDDLKGMVELGGKIGLALNAIQLGTTIRERSSSDLTH